MYVPSIKNILILPFDVREAGITVKETVKTHIPDPTVNDQAIVFPETGLKIPMTLWEMFSYFSATRLSKEDIDQIKGGLYHHTAQVKLSFVCR